MMIYSSLPPLLSVSAPQNTPFLGFFGVFPSHAYIHIYIITDSVFPPLTSYLFWWCFRSLDNTDRISPLFLPPAVPGAAVVGCRSRSFSRLSPPVSDGLSAQTKWRLVVSTPLIRGEGWRYSNIRREEEEGGRKGRRGEVVFVGVRDCPETGSVLCRHSPISICRGQWCFTVICSVDYGRVLSGGK